MRKYRVAQGCCILPPAGSQSKDPIRGGRIITDGDLPAKTIENHVKSGYLLPVNKTEHDEAPEKTIKPGAPGMQEPIKPDTAKTQGDEYEQTVGVQLASANARDPDQLARAQVSPEEAKQRGISDGKVQHTYGYNLNPDTLKGKSFEQLKAMVFERDQSMDVESKDEAIEILSAEYEG